MMNLQNVGFVLEGGAMRGAYTAGVLDYFLEKDLHITYIIGVSAGACQSFSYISRQYGRNIKVTETFIKDHRYLSFRNYIKEKSLFGMNFMFEEIPKNLLYFDYETFANTTQKVIMVATDCQTGKPEYFCNTDNADMFLAGRASSSMPLLSPKVLINEKYYIDGGVSNPIPLEKSEIDGNVKNIVVLTRDAEYRKKPPGKSLWLMKKYYKKYPHIVESYEKRYKVYNDTLEYLIKAERDGRVFIIRPQIQVRVKRMEKNIDKLKDLYLQGLEDTAKVYDKLMLFLN